MLKLLQDFFIPREFKKNSIIKQRLISYNRNILGTQQFAI